MSNPMNQDIGWLALSPCPYPDSSRYPGTDKCMCIVCARCGDHTKNQTQGHYWSMCAARRMEIRGFHFCCPGNCELEQNKGTEGST